MESSRKKVKKHISEFKGQNKEELEKKMDGAIVDMKVAEYEKMNIYYHV